MGGEGNTCDDIQRQKEKEIGIKRSIFLFCSNLKMQV